MSINPLAHVFSKKQLWYLATVCGFAIGFVIGGDILRPSHPWSGPWLEFTFWAFPAAGAGLGMGIGQWILIRPLYKNAYLWIPATTFGAIASTGGTLLLTLIVSMFFIGSLSTFFRNFTDWFVPWIKLLAIVSPVAIMIGAFFQWLVVQHLTRIKSFKELLKMSMGWILAIIVLFIMFGLTGTLFNSRIYVLNLLALIVTTIPSGLIFAHFTIVVISKSLNESGIS